MKKKDVEIGATYVAKVSGKLTRVRIERENPYGGWDAKNVATGRQVRIKSAQRLRYPARPRGGQQSKRDNVVAAILAGRKPDEPRHEYAGDPDVCATVGCDRPAALTYLGRPRCQECYEDEVADDDLPDGQAGQTSDETPNHEETEMAKAKTTTRKSVKKATKHSKAANAGKAQKVGKQPKAAKPAGDAKPERISALDAAAMVLKKAGKPMRAKEMVTAMAEQGLWKSPNGKTPDATLHAAIMQEIRNKGKSSRFRKVDRGQFEFAG